MQLINAFPYPYKYHQANVALVVVDMQRDFVEKGGFGSTLGVNINYLRKTIPVIKNLISAFRENNLTIIYTKEAHKPDLSDCPISKLKRGDPDLKIGDLGQMGRILISGEYGNDIIEEIKPIPGEFVLDKPGKGAFYKTNFDEYLKSKNLTHLIFTGVTTEVCVQTTMREANDRGYECLLVKDATASYNPRFKKAAINMIHSLNGIVGWTTRSKDVLESITGKTLYENNNQMQQFFLSCAG